LTGQKRLRLDRPGTVKAGQGRNGQGWTGQKRPRLDRPGTVKAGQARNS